MYQAPPAVLFSSMSVIILAAIVCGVIGALIGEPRDERGRGAGLGLLLGPLGLLILVLTMPKRPQVQTTQESPRHPEG